MSNFTIQPDCLLLFIDETGHERFADALFPIFGMGGCAEMGSSYQDVVRLPWHEMKDQFFGGRDKPLHASELRHPIEAIANFFRVYDFSRFCAISNNRTDIDDSLLPYHATGATLVERIRRIATHYPFNSIAMIFEASDRTDMLAARFFPQFTFAVDGVEVPIEYRRMNKSLCEPGLEVADFIVHTAGAQVRDQLIGKCDGERKFRKDFDCVFHTADKRRSDYLLIDRVLVNATAP
ncbi:MAG TPA: DUF3800 domain-containing protein [Pyrinomonadaceae bacterium]|nr:DUF3800 domain-containing protein [Pyrinomonadaceae bacterium]